METFDSHQSQVCPPAEETALHAQQRRQLLVAGAAGGLSWLAGGWRETFSEPLPNADQSAIQSATNPQAAGALGERLYKLVKEYAELGDHRTGTSVDERTSKWFAAQLSERGATIEMQEYQFDRYDARVKVTVDGKEVAAWPLYYAATGKVTTDNPYLGSLEVGPGGSGTLNTLLAQARGINAPAVVVATLGAEGRLVALNRRPQLEAQGLPTVFVPGALANQLGRAKVKLEFEAELKPAQSANVIARLGAPSEQAPVMVATSLTGWFKCAGERGTSIAVALELASEIAKLAPVVVVGATGQELYGLGVRQYLQQVRQQKVPRPSAIVHLGGSIAAGTLGKADRGQRVMKLSEQRYVATSLSKPRHDKLIQSLRPLGLQTEHNADQNARNPDRWRGEARLWCLFGVPLLSFAGVFPLFHTPDDLPELTTSPALLDAVSRTATETARRMLTER